MKTYVAGVQPVVLGSCETQYSIVEYFDHRKLAESCMADFEKKAKAKTKRHGVEFEAFFEEVDV